MHLQIVKNPKIANWLDECRSINTREAYSYVISKFFTWYGDSVESFLALPKFDKRHIALKFQNEKRGTVSNNTLSMTMGALNSFLDIYDMKINFKGKTVLPQMDFSSHTFNNGDLRNIFEIGNVKEKCLISLMTSLGWEISSVLELKREKLQQYVDRAKSEGKKYYYFMTQRKKTGAMRLGILNSLALNWLDRWLIESKNIPLRKRDPNRNEKYVESDLFDISVSGANQMLKGLVKKSNLKTTGRVHLHLIRKWVMGNLIAGGMNEWEVKYIVGKKIPSSDFTYLKSLEIGIAEKYPKVYQTRFNLETSTQSILSLTKSLEEKDQELKSQKIQLEQLQKQYDSLHLEKMLERLQQLEKKLQKVKQ